MSKPTIRAIHQLLPSFAPRDAIGNETQIMGRILRDMGFESRIFAEQGGAPAEPLPALEDVADARTAFLYHFSIASRIPAQLASLPVLKLVRYHNVTPPWFFTRAGEEAARQACSHGRRQIPMVGVLADGILADSAYNAAEIAPFSRTTPTVIPVMRDYATLTRVGAAALPALERSGKMSLLFVGRISPNKCQTDLVLLLHLAKRFVSKDLRLILVGGFFSEAYRRLILDWAKELGLTVGTDVEADAEADVLIPRDVSDEAMAALYRHARLFVSLSEHEGFGVPLVEAMQFDLPVLAHAATAVPETVGAGGLLVDKEDWPATLAALKAALFDDGLRDELRRAGRQRRDGLGLPASEAAFRAWIARVTAQPATCRS